MIKSITKLCLAVFTVLAFGSSVGYADSLFRLRLEDVATGKGVVISDNGSGDTSSDSGVITFNGSLGSFSVNVTTGLSKPAIGADSNNFAELDLNSVNISFSGAGTLLITLEDGGYTHGPSGPLSVASLVGGTMTGQAGSSVSFQSWVNGDNQLPALGPDQATAAVLPAIGSLPPAGSVAVFDSPVTFGPGAFSVSGSQEFTKTGSYSLFSQAKIVFTGRGSVSFDQNTNVVPEPITLVLLGSGLASMGLLGRKRKTTVQP